MRGISTLKQTLFCFALIWAFSSVTAFSQCQNGDATDVLINFNDESEGTAGFEGSTSVPGASFLYHHVDRKGHLEFEGVSEGQYVITTPTFIVPQDEIQIDYGFTLGGSVTVTAYSIRIAYIDAGGIQRYTQNVFNSTIPSYANEYIVCSELQKDGMFGTRYRLEITLTTTGGKGNKGSTITFDDYRTTAPLSPDPIILPVNFIGFTARQASTGAQLIWNVADEVDVARYEVQKGTTAGSFRTIGTVPAGKVSTYSFLDAQPTQGVAFYRIRSVDLDGKYKFSTIISFSNGNSMALLRAYPLPARNQVTLQHGTIEGKAQIMVASEDGRVVKRVVPSTGSMQTSIDLSTLKAGLYLLRLESSNGEVQTLKLVKQ